MRNFLVLLLLTVFIPSLVFAQVSSEPASTADLQKQIQDLLKQVQALQQQVNTLQAELGKSSESSPASVQGLSEAKSDVIATPSTPLGINSAKQPQPESSPPELTRSLSRGFSGDDVRKLQEFLSKDKEIYPEGLLTGFFGPLTEAAVKKWQEKHGIESVGIVGPKTISKLQDIGRGVIQGLLERGAGASGVVPPGLLTAPGIQKKLEIATSTPVAATTTPSETIPAVPAVPAVPSSGVGTIAVPATPAIPATPAVTTTTPDTASPVVSNIQASNFTSTSLTITWTTSEASDSQVEYGPTWTYGSSTALNTSLVTSHSVPLSGLTPSTSYQIKVKSKDAAGNLGTGTFATLTSAVSTSTDTIAPSVPTNLTVTVISSTQINLSWTASTDNVGVTGYRIYRGGVQIATVTTGTSYSDTGLTAATTYSYTIAAYDQAGNVSVQSSSVSATTLSASPSAPTNIQAVTNSSGQEQPPIVRYYMVFDYTLQLTTQSFNIYRKRPTDASFVKYTYNAQTPVNGSILPLPGSDESNLYHRSTNQWEWWTTLPAPAPASAAGEYQFYVTAVDMSGVESSPSQTKSFKLYAAPIISSPADGSTVSAPFTITVSGDPNASYYGMTIYKQTIGNTAWSVWPAPSTNFTYTGSVLSPSDNPHRLLVWFSSGVYDRSLFTTSIFNISTTTSSLDSRARNLAAISQALNAIQEKLLKLLQE